MRYSTFARLALLSSTSAASSIDVNLHPRILAPRVTTLVSPTGPQQTGTIGYCDKWYNVVAGDSCDTVEKAFGITHAQFISWNPAVSSDCSQNFWGGYTYCVGVSSTSVKSTSTVKPTSAQRTTSTSVQTGPSKPTLTGLACNCNKFHNVVSGDSCATVEAKFGITHEQFLLWNPAVSRDCATNFWADTAYCVGISNLACPATTSMPTTALPSTWTKTPNTEPYTTIGNETSAEQVDRPTATAWPPSPIQSGSVANCIRYHYVNPGETCQYVVNRYANLIMMEEFLRWNPAVGGTDCTGLYVNYYYCVDVVDTNSLPNATSQYFPTWTQDILPTVDPVFAPEPTAPGADPNCQSWYLAEEGDTCDRIALELGYLGQTQIQQWNTDIACNMIVAGTYYCVADYDRLSLPMPSTVTSAPHPTQGGIVSSCKAWYLSTPDDSCDLITKIFGTFSKSDFLSWNPSLGGITCPGLQSGNYYCIGVPGTPTTRTTMPPNTPAPSNGVGPQPQQLGTIGDCVAFWLVSRGDNCTTLAQANGITEDQIELWNPSVGDGCQNLLPDYYICVGSQRSTTPPAGSTSTSVSSISQDVSASTTSIPVATPTPTQAGMTQSCRRFYFVQPGDGCWAISDAAGISLDDFYNWNPAVKNDCSLLMASVYVCVGTSGPVATITAGSPVAPTPRPVQTGMVSGCARFYLVPGGIFCGDIAAQAGIALSDFYTWNPVVGTSCGGLQPNVYVCIGTSGVPSTTITIGAPIPAKTA